MARGLLDLVKYCVQRDPEYKLEFSLQIAIHSQSLEMVKYFVENGDDINEKDIDEEVALHCAVAESTLEIIKYLFENVADLNGIDTNG